MKNNLTNKFVDYLFEKSKIRHSEDIMHQAKKCLLDYIGVTLAGAKLFNKKGNALLNNLGDNKGQSVVIGFQKKSSLQNAVLLNGFSSHITELDDGMRFGMIHPGTSVISSLISLDRKELKNGKNLLNSIIIGYEAAILISKLVQPSHKLNGFHATGTCGTIGSAAGISVALDLSKEQFKNAVSAAATSSSGLLEMIEDDSQLKPYNAAKASLNGLISALVSRSGIKGPNDPLGGKRGFVLSLSSNSSLDFEIINDYLIKKIYQKPYAACRHCHPAIDAVLKLKKKYPLENKKIKKIKVATYDLAVKGHDHKNILGESSAKMSIPYSVAISLINNKAGIEDFTDYYIKDKNVIELISKVEVFSDEKLSLLVPEKRTAIVEIITNENLSYKEKIDYPKGEPENPLSDEELLNKFVSLATYAGKNENEINKIIEHVFNIENDLDKLFEFL
jgi:2-methylcitrate dehydratase PrpD